MQERQTKQKQIIYGALQALDHPTATEVYGQVHENYPTVSRATVFRVLSGFAAFFLSRDFKFLTKRKNVRSFTVMKLHSQKRVARSSFTAGVKTVKRICGRESEKFSAFMEKRRKIVDIYAENGYNRDVKRKKRRCRLAVWRQLPKLFPASSTLVTCSNQAHFHHLDL